MVQPIDRPQLLEFEIDGELFEDKTQRERLIKEYGHQVTFKKISSKLNQSHYIDEFDLDLSMIEPKDGARTKREVLSDRSHEDTIDLGFKNMAHADDDLLTQKDDTQSHYR